MFRLALVALVAVLAAASCARPVDPAPGVGAAGDATGLAGGEPGLEAGAGGGDRAEASAPTDGTALADPLRLAMARPGPVRPDEVVLTDQPAVIVSDLLYDGLTEAVGRHGRLRPGLAASWTADADFTTWTFILAPDAAVDVDAAVASLARLTTDGRGGRPAAGAVLAAGMRRVTAGEGRSIVIELERPNAGLPWVLSGLPYAIVGPSGEPTGDYDVTADDANGMLLHRRPRSRPGPNRSDALPGELQLTWVGDGAEAHRLLGNGSVDAAVVGPGQVPVVDDRPIATAATRFYVLNGRSAALASPESRWAVLGAIDRRALIQRGLGQSVVAVDGLVGPDHAGWSTADRCAATCGRAGARGEAERPATIRSDRSPLSVSFSGDDQRPLAAAIAAQLSAAQLDAQANERAPDELAAMIVAGQTDLFAFGWIAPATSLDAVIPPMLRVDSPANVAMVQSVEVADLLAVAAVTADDRARWDLLAEAHRVALDDGLILPIAASASLLALGPGVEGAVVRADGSLDLESAG